MSKTTLTTLLIVLGLIIFAIGGGLGVFFQQQTSQLPVQQTSIKPQAGQNADLLRILSSSLISPIVAHGNVAGINGRNVSLNFGGTNLTVKINQDAKVYSFSASSGQAQTSKSSTTQPEGKFEDIKVGDSVNITLQLLPDGTMGGKLVSILSTPPSTNGK